MQRIFEHRSIQYITLTPDLELNILVYRTPSYVIMGRVYKGLKMVQFFGPPCTYLLFIVITSLHMELIDCYNLGIA